MKQDSSSEKADQTAELKHSRTEWLKWVVPSVTSILMILVGVILSQLFLNRTAIVGERAKLKREIINLQYPHLQKIRRFARIGKVAQIAIVHNFFGNVESEKREVYLLPKIAYDEKARLEWERLAGEIAEASDLIEPEIYEIHEMIVSYTKKHPIPVQNGSDYTYSEISGYYSDHDNVKSWVLLNEYLLLKTEKFLAMEE